MYYRKREKRYKENYIVHFTLLFSLAYGKSILKLENIFYIVIAIIVFCNYINLFYFQSTLFDNILICKLFYKDLFYSSNIASMKKK